MDAVGMGFRELNYERILQLKKSRNLSDSTIASIIYDESGVKGTGEELAGYLKYQGGGSHKMLVSEETFILIMGKDMPHRSAQPQEDEAVS